MNEVDRAIDELLTPHTAAIRALTRDLMGRVLALQPALRVDASVKLSAVYFKRKRVVCALTVHKAHVNLHFYKGTQLPDPDNVLQGSGKSLRHLRFSDSADIDEAHLAHFVAAAWAVEVG